MGVQAFACPQVVDDKYEQMTEYLSSEGGYWKNNDKWYLDAGSFQEAGIKTGKTSGELMADFGGFHAEGLKTEMKYYLLFCMKEKHMTATSISRNYKRAIMNLGAELKKTDSRSFNGLSWGCSVPEDLGTTERNAYRKLYRGIVSFITDHYGGCPETEKDIWHVLKIPGVKVSATGKRKKATLNFEEIPLYYRAMVKQFMARLVIKRSSSYCVELLVYIRYFFRAFYGHGYVNGFFEKLQRRDIEKYLEWVAADHADKNATYRSKAVSFMKLFIDYIQLAEYPLAPAKDVNRLIFDDDAPRRERYGDTLEKVKYIPEPVREQLDAGISEIEPAEMMPLYVLLRETGWRGTDVLNLRYDSCLDYYWNVNGQKYVPYLCGEITKTGKPLVKVPVRPEVAAMVKKLADEAQEASTEDNNPDRYLFNTYEGKNKGLPIDSVEFSDAVKALIEKKGILDGDGKLHHFKTHSLRHTRAQEYAEQGMPIGIIQQMLSHCSLQMTLHYAKVSENMLYKKWEETEKLNLLHLESKQPVDTQKKEEGVRYESIRKNLDAVKVPFGVCFKPQKLSCRQQTNHCLECASFCSGPDNLPEYEAEIKRALEQVELSGNLGRGEWVQKNQKYADSLKEMASRIQKEGTVHKNGKLREGCGG